MTFQDANNNAQALKLLGSCQQGAPVLLNIDQHSKWAKEHIQGASFMKGRFVSMDNHGVLLKGADGNDYTIPLTTITGAQTP